MTSQGPKIDNFTTNFAKNIDFFFRNMLQMSWNFDTRSKIRQKTQNVLKKSIWRHCDVILTNFFITNKELWFFHFYGGLNGKNTKNYVTVRKRFDFWTTNIFLQVFGTVLAPYDYFFVTYANFNFSLVLY